jgi:hypothetical protein
MDVLTAILSCTLHNDPALVRGIINVNSEGKRFWVGDLTEMRGNGAAQSAAEADRLVVDVRKKGHTVAVGLMALRPEWAGLYGRSAGQLWGACANVEVGSARLSDFDYQCRHGKTKSEAIASSRNRACILGKYAAALGLPKAFVADVLKNVFEQPRPAEVDESSSAVGEDDLTAGELDSSDEDVAGEQERPGSEKQTPNSSAEL